MATTLLWQLWLLGEVAMACNPYLGYTHFRLSSASDCTGFHSQYAETVALRFYSSKEELEPTWQLSTTTCEVVIFFRMDLRTVPIVRLEMEGTVGKVYQLECGWSQYTYTSVAMTIHMTAPIQYKYCDILVCEDTAPTTESTTESTSTTTTTTTTASTATTVRTTTTASTTTTTTTSTINRGQTEITLQDPCNPFDGTRYLRLSNCGPVYNADCNSRWEPNEVVAFGQLVGTSSNRPRDGELSLPKRIMASSVWWHDWTVGLGCSCFQEAKYRNATLDLNLPGDFSVTSIEITQGASPIDKLCIDCLGENTWRSPLIGTPAPPSASLQVQLSREKTIIQCDAAGCTVTQEPVWQDPRCEAGGSVGSSIEPFQSKLWSLLVLLYLATS